MFGHGFGSRAPWARSQIHPTIRMAGPRLGAVGDVRCKLQDGRGLNFDLTPGECSLIWVEAGQEAISYPDCIFVGQPGEEGNINKWIAPGCPGGPAPAPEAEPVPEPVPEPAPGPMPPTAPEPGPESVTVKPGPFPAAPRPTRIPIAPQRGFAAPCPLNPRVRVRDLRRTTAPQRPDGFDERWTAWSPRGPMPVRPAPLTEAAGPEAPPLPLPAPLPAPPPAPVPFEEAALGPSPEAPMIPGGAPQCPAGQVWDGVQCISPSIPPISPVTTPRLSPSGGLTTGLFGRRFKVVNL